MTPVIVVVVPGEVVSLTIEVGQGFLDQVLPSRVRLGDVGARISRPVPTQRRSLDLELAV